MLLPASENDPQQPNAEPPQADAPKAKRPQPNPNHRANLRHGLRCSQLPAGCSGIQNTVKDLRTRLEDALLARGGDVSFVQACAINTACRHEQHALLAAKWLREEGPKLSAEQRLRFADAAIAASEKRDRIVGRLLGEPSSASASPYASLYGDPDGAGHDHDHGPADAAVAPPRSQGDSFDGSNT